jgi:ribonuclease P protein component
VKRAQRLRTGADFQRVRAARRSWAHPLLVLYAAPNELGVSRLGVSVGKRVARQAVVRNRVRRRVREAVRLRYARLAPGHDLLFIARTPGAEASWAELSGAVEQLLHRARLLQEETG